MNFAQSHHSTRGGGGDAMITRLRRVIHMRRSVFRWWVQNSTPTRWIRHFIYLLGALIFAIGVIAVGMFRLQANEIDNLTLSITPAIDTNDQVFQAMTEADSGLLGYQISHDLSLLTSYQDAYARTVTALATLQGRLDSLRVHDDIKDAIDSALGNQQYLAVEMWWTYAQGTEQAVIRGENIDILQGHALFNSFRQANAALNGHLTAERSQSLRDADRISKVRMLAVIITTLTAFLTTIVLGLRYSRSVSQPITALRDTMSRQREGEMDTHAREDQGSPEIRSLAVDFNALAEKNLASLRRAEDVSARMASLVDLSLTLGQKLSLDALLARVVESARKILGARYAALGVLDATGNGLAEFVTAGLSAEEEAAIGELPQGKGLLGAMIRDPKALRLDHISDDPRSTGFPPNHPRMDSFLGVPIVIHGEVFGNLFLTEKIGGPFSAEDEQLAQSFALQAAVAVENVRRYEQEIQLVKMLESVREIESAIRTATDIQQVLDVLCIELGERIGVDRVIVKTVDSDFNPLLDAEWHQPDLQSVGDRYPKLFPKVGGLAVELWESSQPRAITDFLTPQVQSEERAQALYQKTGARAVIFAPIGIVDRVIGIIYVIKVHQPHQWVECEVNLVRQVAASAAQVIVEIEYRMHQSEHIQRLERLERQQTNFVATVSHELRTPLTSISGYLELLSDGYAGELSAEQKQMVEVMDRNTNRLSRLIEDLLVLNRSDSRSVQSEAAEVSIYELIDEACRELPPIAKSDNITLDIEVGPIKSIVSGDRGQLKSVIVNIISNAIKFSRPGGVVTIRCSRDEVAGRIRIICVDRGIGIPAEDQQRLFTRFFRAANATEQQIPGTGLGLTIAKQIVEDHGGQVRLTSVEGEGTTVVIDLPLSTRTSL